jgi:hypothetical protein
MINKIFEKLEYVCKIMENIKKDQKELREKITSINEKLDISTFEHDNLEVN